VPEFAGINHVALTVRDLDVSARFYCDLLGFIVVLDVGYGRICIHRGTGFSIALLHHEGTSDDRFSPLRTGLDHLGLAVGTRAELVQWEQRLRAAGAPCSPIQDMPLGHHLNFTDPDGIALELQAPNAVYAAALVELRDTALSDDDVRERAAHLLQVPGVAQG
jgi:glyoxylase I family protein